MSHQWADALAIDDPNWEQGEDPSGNPIYGNHYGESGTDPEYYEPVTDPPPGMTGVLQGWRYIRPDHALGLLIVARSFQGTNCTVGVWTRSGGLWTTVIPPTAPAPTQSLHFDVVVGPTYYLMFALSVDAYDAVMWDAYLGRTLAELNADAPPMAIGVQLNARIPGETDEQIIPPIGVRVRAPAPFDQPGLAVPPIGVNVASLVPEVWTGGLTLSAPADGAVVLTDTPTFVVGVTSPDDEAVYTLDVQYADDAVFTNPITMTATVNTTDGGAVFTPAAAVPATTYWRARLSEDGGVRVGWTSALTFTTDTVITPTVFPVTWTVDSTAERPIHVWHFDPAGPLAGDTMTLYGQGFPASGTLLYGDTVLPTLSWGLVPASADNDDDTLRIIDGDTVTPEHFEVTFTAPAADGPGAPLSLEG